MESRTHWSDTTTERGLKAYTSFVGKRDAGIGAFLEFDPNRGVVASANRFAGSGSGGVLGGLPFAVKDNIAVKSFRLTCGSRMLEHFVSPYSATVVERLTAAGAVAVGKTNLDEFGMGSSCDNSALATTNNPWDSSRVAGGSSGGSAAAVAAGLVPFAIGTDTGGSVRQPANFCGVYGLKPSYGALSRYGLVAYASSLECAGIIAADVAVLKAAFAAMRGLDERDQTTVDPAGFGDSACGTVKKIGVLAGSLGLDPAVAEGYERIQSELAGLGYELEEVQIPILDYAVPAYYTIATAEASANLARFNGIRYGYRPVYSENPEELVRLSRDGGFGPEVKLRILLGTYVLRSGFQDQFYHRAQKIRTAIVKEFDRLFGAVDCLLLPVFPTQAFPHGSAGLDSFQQKVADKFTTAANLTGLPALAVPTGSANGLPLGVQFMAPNFCEDRLFGLAERLAQRFPVEYPPDSPPVYALGQEADS